MVTLCVYAQTAGFAFVGLDDDSYVSENPHVMGGPTAPNIAWAWTTTTTQPMSWVSRWRLAPDGCRRRRT